MQVATKCNHHFGKLYKCIIIPADVKLREVQ